MRKLFLMLLFTALTCWAADPIFGTWKINLEKSELANPTIWKGREMIIESAGGDAYKITLVDPNGKNQRTEEIRYQDSREHPRTTDAAETLTTHTINDHHRILIFKRNGREFNTTDSIISADGKVMTNSVKGVNNGKEIRELRVWDRESNPDCTGPQLCPFPTIR